MHGKLRNLTEDLSQLERHTCKLTATAKTVNRDLMTNNKQKDEGKYLDNLIETLLHDGENMQYTFYRVDLKELKEAVASQGDRDVQSPVAEVRSSCEDLAQRSLSDSFLFLNSE